MTFVDTGPWFAATFPNDPNRGAVSAWPARNHGPLVTTDYVVDELLTLLKVRGEFQRAVLVGGRLLSGAVARLEWVNPEDVRTAWEAFRDFEDKGWSFTDCVSRAVMERLGVTTAPSLDQHFRQFGTVVVVPN